MPILTRYHPRISQVAPMIRSPSIRLAFGYKAQSGKDTACDLITTWLSPRMRIHRLKFAKPVYDISHYIQEVCGFPKEKDRALLQSIGTWARRKDPNVWVHHLERQIVSCYSGDSMIVTDLRYPNEAEMLKTHGFKRIHIHRQPPQCRMLVHESECAMDSYGDWDYLIDNTSDMNALKQQLVTMLHSLYPETLEWPELQESEK